jgi:hypothetical protein
MLFIKKGDLIFLSQLLVRNPRISKTDQYIKSTIAIMKISPG